MITKKSFAFLSLLGVFVPSAHAAAAIVDTTFSYTYLQVGWSKQNLAATSDDLESVDVKASFTILPFLHALATYSDGHVQYSGVNSHDQRLGAGLGAHIGVLPKLDLVTELQWIFERADAPITNADGIDAYAGVRWEAFDLFGADVELFGGGRYIGVKDIVLGKEHVQGWEAGARIHVLSHLSIGGTFQRLDNENGFMVDLRASL